MRALYWQEVDKDVMMFNPKTGKPDIPYKITRELKSDNPLVTHAVITGSFPELESSDLIPAIHLVSGEIKPGLNPENTKVKRFNKTITADQVESLDIPEAIEWINNLKPDE